MATPLIGQIALFAFGYAPKGWAMCQGQLLPVSQNTALFSVLGTTYGGDGKTTFALPNLQGRVAVGAGQSPGRSSYALGDSGGEAAVALSAAQMPGHTHAFVVSTDPANADSPQGNLLARAINPNAGGQEPVQTEADFYAPDTSHATTALAPGALATAGGNEAHTNLQPFLALTLCIALQGAMPQRP